MKKIYFIILISLVSTSAFCNFDWNANCKQAYSDIIQLKFKSGALKIELEKQTNPQNKLPFLIEDYIDYLKIQIGEEKSDFENLKDNKHTRMEMLKKGDQKSAWFLFSQAEVHLHWAANRMKFKEFLGAAYEIKKAYTLLEENNKKFPSFLPNKKSLGLLHTLIGSVPDNYKWILSIIGMDGSVELGMNELESVIENAKNQVEYSYLLEETYFYYAFLKMNLQNDKEGLLVVLDEIKNSEYLILNFTASRIATKIGDNDLAISILENRKQEEEHYPFLYLDLLIGEGKLNKLDLSAKKYFENYLANFNGENYLKSAYMKLSWIYFLEDDFDNFQLSQQRINDVGTDLIDADKEAQKEFEIKFIPNQQLLKSRLLFDGGEYEKSLIKLKEIENTSFFSNGKFNIEYHYRSGRINEKLGNIEQAKKDYKKTIDIGSTQKYYFASNSALQLALIYENEKKLIEAQKYFLTCIEMENHEYEQSIEQKAEAGLNRISN